MAASASDMYPKRKMEDITNTSKKPRLDDKTYFPTLQERSPSPSSPCSSSPPQKEMMHRKSVSFELSRNQHYECPLLTPKDEDYYSESEAEEPKPEFDRNGLIETEMPEPARSNMDENVDYITLSSTASLLQNTRENIQANIRELSALRSKTQRASKSDLVDFYARLICDKTSLPAQHGVVKAPSIDWGKYHKGLGNVSLSNDCTNDHEKLVFQALNIFMTP